MFRNADKKRIYQEEVYRREVRAQLDKTNQKNNKATGKMWTFVNSAFFLWFLSSVVIGIISFSYAKWDEQRGIERERRERAALVEQENIQRARKLDAEISSRLTYFFYSQDIPKTVVETEVMEVEVDSALATRGLSNGRMAEVLKTKGDSSDIEDSPGETGYDTIPLSEDAIMSLNNPKASDYKSGDPEYANRSLRSLLVELEAVAPPQEKNEISLALNRFIDVQPKFIRIIKELKKGKPSNVKIDAATFNDFCNSVNLKRWGVVIPRIAIETEVNEIEIIRK
jgi:hypothetical protein